jgi:hypothetical protein
LRIWSFEAAYGEIWPFWDLATLQQMTSSNAFFVLSFLIETALRIYLRPRHAPLTPFFISLEKMSDTKNCRHYFASRAENIWSNGIL